MQIGNIKPIAAALGVAFALALPAAASAETTFCVNASGCVGTQIATPQAALDAAKANPGDDIVQLGRTLSGYPGPLVYDDPSPDNNVTLRGFVSEATGVVPQPFTPTTVELASGSTVEDLTIAAPNLASGGTGLLLHGGDARRVRISYEGTSLDTKGLVVDGSAQLTELRIEMVTGAAITVQGTGVVVDGFDVFARGRYGVRVEHGAKLELERARIWARSVGAVASGSAAPAEKSRLMMRNAELLTYGAGADGIVGMSSSDVRAQYVTALHLGPGGGTGLTTRAIAGASQAVLANSVIDGFEEHSLERQGVSPYAAQLFLVHSSFDPTTALIGPGQGLGGTSEQANIFAPDPMFVDRPLLEPTEAHDLRLRPGSALVDAGTESSGDIAFDFEKLDRVTDGNGDGVELPDIGAHELQPQPVGGGTTGGGDTGGTGGTGGTGAQEGGTAPMTDTLAPALSGVRAGVRRARFHLTEQAQVTLRLKRRGTRRVRVLRMSGAAGANRISFRRRARRLRAGRYRLAVRAVDSAGNRSSATVLRFRVPR